MSERRLSPVRRTKAVRRARYPPFDKAVRDVLPAGSRAGTVDARAQGGVPGSARPVRQRIPGGGGRRRSESGAYQVRATDKDSSAAWMEATRRPTGPVLTVTPAVAGYRVMFRE